MPTFHIVGDVLIACNCDWGCPCNFNARPSRGFCQGGWIWSIESGQVDDVTVDGLGVADGSIIPVIITAHIAHNRTRCGGSQTSVIIQALAPVIGPYMSRDNTTIHAHETSGTRMSKPTSGHDRARMWTRDCRMSA